MEVRLNPDAWKAAYFQKKWNSQSLRVEKGIRPKENCMFSQAETASTGLDLKNLEEDIMLAKENLVNVEAVS